MADKKGPKKGSKKKRPLTVNPRQTEKLSEGPGVEVHKHCVNCGVSIPPNRETCSEKCQAEWDKMLKRKKFWNYLPLFGALFLAFLWLIMALS